MRLEKNIGMADRILRFGVSAFMIYVALFNETLLKDQLASLILGIFGSIILLSALVGACPLYTLIGFNSAGDANDE